jgi:hypothetical protein
MAMEEGFLAEELYFDGKSVFEGVSEERPTSEASIQP